MHYGGDVFLAAIDIKSIVDTGWRWNNPYIGAPGGLELYDYPFSAHDTFHLVVLKIMSLLGGD